MRFSPTVLLLSLTTLAAAAIWPQSYWAGTHQIGGSGGTPFNLVAEQGTYVQRIRFCWNDNYLRGIRLTYRNGAQAVTGREEGSCNSYTLNEAKTELIRSMTLWGDGKGSKAGRVRFVTSLGVTYDVGKKNTDGQEEFHMDVGSGVLLGFIGRSGLDIDKLSPVFLRSA
ncbi:Jacalin-like lectin domain-containing protein [Podospora appendiculata]|uniref:Jacalin-like lectin domain-containing protein n=1 Tax=Podospora appendiculata TaxID=314037 RepID=A0AAE0X6G9_9PEZI|nr:Jacalin-like lectin domain-containing protein [Podospora appendiculata]